MRQQSVDNGAGIDLLQELRVAWLYAEFARAAGSWHHLAIRNVVIKRVFGEKQQFKSQDTFRSLRKGHLPQWSKLIAYQRAFPRLPLMLAAKHPLAEMLCDDGLGHSDILDRLYLLRPSPTREAILARQHPRDGHAVWTEQPVDENLLWRLRCQGSPVSLYMLVALACLARIRGETALEIDFESAIWDCLASAGRRSSAVAVSLPALIRAVAHFLDRPPFGQVRYDMLRQDDSECVLVDRGREAWAAWATPDPTWGLTADERDYWKSRAGWQGGTRATRSQRPKP